MMKRLLLPFLLLGLAVLPSGISAAKQRATWTAAERSAQGVATLPTWTAAERSAQGVATLPVSGGHPKQGIDDEDEQDIEQENEASEEQLIDVQLLPIVVNATICGVIAEDVECEGQGASQDTTQQSNEAEQEVEDDTEQELDQDNNDHSYPSHPVEDQLPATGLPLEP